MAAKSIESKGVSRSVQYQDNSVSYLLSRSISFVGAVTAHGALTYSGQRRRGVREPLRFCFHGQYDSSKSSRRLGKGLREATLKA
ncbi:hypothetical protein AB1N83_008019 [Pleurotus pulmonarius]